MSPRATPAAEPPAGLVYRAEFITPAEEVVRRTAAGRIESYDIELGPRPRTC